MSVKKRCNVIAVLLLVLAVISAVCSFMLRPMITKGSEITNEYLFLSVQENKEDSTYGSFMLLENGSETMNTLTYSQFYSSYAMLNINGADVRFSDGEQVKAPYIDEDGSIVMVQDFSGLEVTQRLSFATGASDKQDMLRIAYSAENKTGAEALLSIRLVIDPMLNGSEKDLVQTFDDWFKYEKTLAGNNVPDEWYIKDAAGNIMAYGITSDSSETVDKFHAADWENLYNSRTEYTADTNFEINDNAVALVWSDKKLADGETFDCATKYGLYSSEQEKTESKADTESKDDTTGTSKTDSKADTNKTNKTDTTKTPNTGNTGDKHSVILAVVAVLSSVAAVIVKRKGDKSV